MKKETFLSRHDLTEKQFSGKEKIKGSLDLSSLTAIPEGFNPTVGGDLDLSSLTDLPEGFNPTVGGDLDLSSLTSIPENFNPTVGGDLYLRSRVNRIRKTVQRPKINRNFFWDKNGNRFALIDGLFCELLTKRKRIIKGKTYNLYSAKKVNRNEYFFITNFGKNYAHGQDLNKALSDLQFKLVADKLKKKPIKKDTIITVNHYRLITGACELEVLS